MVLETMTDAVNLANQCRVFKNWDIDVRSKNRRYIVDGKSIMGLSILVGGGELEFTIRRDDGVVVVNELPDFEEGI